MSDKRALFNYLKTFHLFHDDEISWFCDQTVAKKIRKFQFLIQAGDTCNEVAFMISGLFRSYYLNEAGEELTYCIHFPHSLTAAYSSYITGHQTEENIQAISNAEVLVISKKVIEDSSKKNSAWIEFQKIIAEQQYIELEKRIFQLQKTQAAERYRNLLLTHPEYVHQIPLQYLASYLGITQRHLSRIRSHIDY